MDFNVYKDKLFSAAAEAGFSDCEVYYSLSDSFEVMVFEGEVSNYEVNSTAGLSFRGLVNGKMGYAYTEAMEEADIKMLVEKAKESAEANESQDEKFIFAGSPSYHEVNNYEPALEEITPRQKINLALKMEAAAKAADEKITAVGESIVASSSGEVRIANTNGLSLKNRDNYIMAYVEPIAGNGSAAVNGGEMCITRDFYSIDADALAEKAAKYAVSMLEAERAESGEYEIILSNQAACSLLAAFSGIFSAEAAQRGLSRLNGREGEMIASEKVTLLDDPLLEGGLASCGFDAEGVATYTKQLISKGKLNTLMYDLKTAAKAGKTSTGNASKGSYKSTVGISYTNLTFEKGEGDEEEFCRRAGEGLLVTELAGLHAGANAITGDFSLMAKGYVVRGGKKAEAVSQVTVSGNFYELLKNIKAVGSDMHVSPAGGGMVICPSLMIGKLTVAGK